MRLVFLLAMLAACGSVSNKNPDAGHDGPGSGSGHVDAAIDGAQPTPVTAVGAGNLTQFTASTTDARVLYVADYDDLGEWSASTSTFTAKSAGDYLICASLYLTNSFSTVGDMWLYKNGARHQILAEGSGIVGGCRTLRLAANDTLAVDIFASTNTPITVTPDANWDWMTIERVTQVATAITSTTLSSTSGQFVVVPYDTATVNDGSLFNTTTHQLKPTTAGDYQVCASLKLDPSTLEGEIDLYINGNREKAISNGVDVAGGCRSVRLAANDAVDVRFFQNTLATASLLADSDVDWVDIQKQPISLSVGGIGPLMTASHTWVQVPYTTAVFDDASQWSASSHTFTAATAGDYQVCASLLVPSSTADTDEIDIYKNGAREKGLAFGHFGLSGCRVMRLAANDQVQIWQYTLGDKTYTTDANWDWLEVSKLR